MKTASTSFKEITKIAAEAGLKVIDNNTSVTIIGNDRFTFYNYDLKATSTDYVEAIVSKLSRNKSPLASNNFWFVVCGAQEVHQAVGYHAVREWMDKQPNRENLKLTPWGRYIQLK